MTRSEPTAPPSASSTPEDVGAWLLERVAHYLPETEGRIDPAGSLAEYGLDSVYAVELCGGIEDVWGLTVEPTIIWEVDTVAELTDRVRALIAARPAA